MKYNNSPSTSHPPRRSRDLLLGALLWPVQWLRVFVPAQLRPSTSSFFFFLPPFFTSPGVAAVFARMTTCCPPMPLFRGVVRTLKTHPGLQKDPGPPENLRGCRLRNLRHFSFPFARRRAYFTCFQVVPPTGPPVSPMSSATLRPPLCSRKAYSCKKKKKENPGLPMCPCVTKENRITISSFAGLCF